MTVISHNIVPNNNIAYNNSVDMKTSSMKLGLNTRRIQEDGYYGTRAMNFIKTNRINLKY